MKKKVARPSKAILKLIRLIINPKEIWKLAEIHSFKIQNLLHNINRPIFCIMIILKRLSISHHFLLMCVFLPPYLPINFCPFINSSATDTNNTFVIVT